jgi:hypothetical protein
LYENVIIITYFAGIAFNNSINFIVYSHEFRH